jgi:hypothetical protein
VWARCVLAQPIQVLKVHVKEVRLRLRLEPPRMR